ncbi:hypothetical protein [Methylobacterium oxalidis]|uniref:Chromosome partition protein Smc n=1 Tax=Methylobacterium oxalidis TaxID=944322 RepID=A0A512IXP5_9HYPH|nr:hypothetical protein [Methylobacterium oxalidis]GEP02369.1 hypothetical protein MOX02_04070 [Methylobacterium oxalidis]GLS67748.1 hypothetical protein GCM10007888_61330 [Methylobacterium oxalidis]
MIETLMIFALGVLAASLCILLVLPAVNARAARLARRRVEAMFPLSASEISAEKDFLRAQFAVQQRRLERRAESALARRHADMAEIGARSMEVAKLSRDVETRDRTLVERDGEIATARTDIARLTGDLDTARSEGATGLATLHALEEAHCELLDNLIATRHERDAARAAAEAPTTPASDDLRRRYDELLAEREALRASLAAAEDALAQALGERGAGAGQESIAQENAELRRRITEVADALTQRERLPSVSAFPAAART